MSAPTITDGTGAELLSQLNTAFANAWKAMQSQDATAATSAGAAPTFTLTVTPAVTAYALFQRFCVKFHAAGTTGSNTLNVSGLGAKSLKQLAPDGSLVDAVITSGMIVDLIYDGTYFIVLEPAPYLATTAEAQALTNQQHLLTPYLLAQALKGSNQSLAASGYQKLPGGLILQWGISGTLSTTVTFPVAFPSACVSAVVSVQGSTYLSFSPAITALSATSMSLTQNVYNSQQAQTPVYWIAIGY